MRRPVLRLPALLALGLAAAGCGAAPAGRGPAASPDALAAAAAEFMEQARDTGDASYYARADEAVERALRLEPRHYESLRLRAWVLDGEHRFGDGAGAARRARALRPSDPFNYGTLGDALVELGDYDGAGRAFQTMLDLRPDSAAYARAAYLRELFGDPEGAIEMMRLAADSADPKRPARRAWCLAQIADLRLSQGDAAGALAEDARALRLAPRSAAALAGLARALAAEGRLDEAADAFGRSVLLLPAPAVAADYGDLLSRLGRRDEAAEQFRAVEAVARLQRAAGIHDRAIALFRADHGGDPVEAFGLAEEALAGRDDIYDWDAVGWCALKAGRLARAEEAMGRALRLGTRDARLEYHAALVADAAGRREEARRRLRRALAINPRFDPRAVLAARRALEER